MAVIETQGCEWAKAVWESRGVDLQKTALVVGQEDRGIMELPPLVGQNLGLRYDSLGYIFAGRWRSVGRGQLDGYQLLYPYPDHVRSDYLSHLPQSREQISALEYAQYDSIETAIRAQQRVVDKTGERELPQAEAVISEINRLTGIVLAEKLNGSWLKWLADETDIFLGQSGLVDARSPHKVKLVTMLQLAWQHDQKNRLNEGATRFRLRSAYLLAVRQLVFEGRVADTHNRVRLEYERELERWALEETATAFEIERAQTPIQRTVLGQIVTEIDQNLLTLPRVRPYLAPARIVSLALVGSSRERLGLDRAIINDDSNLNLLLGQLTVKDMIETNQFDRAGQRMNELRDYLHRVLAV